MRWTDRQQAMLREMGLRLWLPASPAAAAAAAADVGAASMPSRPLIVPSAPLPSASVDRVSLAAPADASKAQGPAEDAARAASVATLAWPELRAAVAACRACALCEGRRQTVFGVGHERAHWMIVGEAPGEQEDLRGEPFVGAAGRLLDRMLQALDLTRAEAAPERQVFIANALKCRPPHNRNPTPQELAQCRPYLERQVELVQPRVILALGRFAVQSLLGSSEPIGRLRGRVHRWRGRPLVVSYHPAYLLRQPAEKARAWADLCLAAQVSAEEAPPSSG